MNSPSFMVDIRDMSTERDLEAVYRPFVEAKEAADVALFDRKGISLPVVQETVREGFLRAETLLRLFQAQDPPVKSIVCRAGCALCCHRFAVSAAPSEIVQLLVVLKSRPDIAELKVRIRETWSRIRTMSDPERTAAGVACPLLVHDKCTVYDDRPQSCRACNSMDFSYCQRPEGSVLAYPHQLMIHRAIHAGLMGAAAKVGLESTPVELVHALHIGLNTPGVVVEFLRRGSPLAEAYAFEAFAV